MPTEQEIEQSMEETAKSTDGRTTTVLRTGAHGGLAATVTVERWLEVGADEEGGTLAVPMVRIDAVYDGFEEVTAFPFVGAAAQAVDVAEWAIGDMVEDGYHERIMLERLDQTEVALTPEEFVPAIRAVMAKASDLVRAEFGL